jgi:hypothetical protein
MFGSGPLGNSGRGGHFIILGGARSGGIADARNKQDQRPEKQDCAVDEPIGPGKID